MDSKLKCILLDDELPGLAYLKMLCGQLPELEVVKAFNDPQKFRDAIDAIEFDLCITDIEMPGISGLELAASLHGKLVIFITAYKEYAANAFDMDAVDYIVKPVKMERLHKAVHKAVQHYAATTEKPSFMQVVTDQGRKLLYFHRIALISTAEKDSRDKNVVLDDQTQLLLKNINFQTLLSALPAADFCRVNKAEIIAMKAVKFFSHNQITLDVRNDDGKLCTVLLSDTYKTEFLGKAGTKPVT